MEVCYIVGMITNTPTDRAEQAAKGIADFTKTMTYGANRLKRNFVVNNSDADGVSFILDGYSFTFSWGETTRVPIGRSRWIVQYTLCVWSETQGGRWNPPEQVDTTLVTDQSINACVRVAFETVAKDEIRQALEDVDYAQLAEQLVEEAG